MNDLAIKYGYFSEGALNMTFEAYGYASMYLTGNMPFVFMFAIIIFGVWCLALLKDLCVKRSNGIFKGGIRDIFLLNNHW